MYLRGQKARSDPCPGYPHSKETRRFIEAQEGRIELVYLPPYSPERVVLGIVRSFQKQNDLVRSFFQLLGTRYILKAMK